MSSTDRRTREREAQRERILSAARALFVTEGIEAVTLRRIASSIEYTAPALYTHFPDKQTLLTALCHEDFALFRRRLEEAAGQGDPLTRLRRLGRGYVRFALDHPHQYRFLFMTPFPPRDAARSNAQALPAPDSDPGLAAYEVLRRTVRDAHRAALLRPGHDDVERTSQVMWAGCHGLVALHLIFADGLPMPWGPVETVAGELVDAMVDGVAGSSVPDGDRAQRRRAESEERP